MSHWGVQIVIGRLLTDEHFRRRFEQRRRECLTGLRERGIDLNDAEMEALVEAEPGVWSTMASRIDQRLQNSRLRPEMQGKQVAQKPLTEREQHVLGGVFEGLTNKQIAAEIGVSEGAVKATLQHLFRKTHVRTRAQLVRIAVEGSLGVTPVKR
jgi:DNA-binding NarL/FixJ family response regulator